MLVNTIASIEFTFGSKLGFFLVLSSLIQAGSSVWKKVFRKGYLAAFSTALRSATEENESGGHVDVPCSSKVKQHKITAYWLNFCDVTRSVATERVRNKIFIPSLE